MTLKKIIEELEKSGISTDIEIDVRIDFLRKTHDNAIRYTKCDTAYTEVDCNGNRKIVLCGTIYE